MLKRWAVFAIALVAVVLIVAGTQTLRAPVPVEQYQECIQTALKYGAKNIECRTNESVWQRTISDPVAYFTFWLTAFTAILGAIGVTQIILGHDEFIAANRPILYARNVTLNDAWASPRVAPDREVSGKLIVANKGGTDAEIVASYIEICWSNFGVPTEFYYDSRLQEKTTRHTKIEAGDFLVVEFTSGSISFGAGVTGKARDTSHSHSSILGDVATTAYNTGRDRTLSLYVLGWVRFRDYSGTIRQMGFCRRYDPEAHRFRIVNDTDFEYEA